MENRYKAFVAGAAVVIGAASVAATAVSAQDSPIDVDDEAQDAAEGPDVPITGPDLDRASAVALDFTGEGTVTATEIEDEESYYEVEVTLDNGSEVDVQLDEDFTVVGTD
ncbi:MAG: PepSY domain-containing protein [Acidimicrobiales bacterium]